MRKSLEQVRWMLKARELPAQFCPVLLELVLDMIADVSPGALRDCRVTLEEGTGPLPRRYPGTARPVETTGNPALEF